jgi:LysM repeat protein
MAAVLSPRTDLTPLAATSFPGTAPWNQPGITSTGRPQLRLVEGGRTAARTGHGLRRALLVVAAGVAVAALVALAAVGAVQLLGADAAASVPASTTEPLHPAGAGASTSSAPAVVVVRPGDTLWAIARRIQPTGDVRQLVDQLADRNGGAGLVAGQTLDVSGLLG